MVNNMIPSRVLFIEKNQKIAKVIKEYFENTEFEIFIPKDIPSVVKGLIEKKFSVILIDTNMGRSGCFDFVSHLRRNKDHTPIIVISDPDNELELKVYRQDANLFHPKPLKLDLLHAQLQQLSGKHRMDASIQLKDVEVDMNKRIFKIKNHEIDLTYTEFDLICMLFSLHGQILTREKILSQIHEKDVGWTSVDTMICRIRTKLKKYTDKQVIETVNRLGYRIDHSYFNHQFYHIPKEE